MTAGTPVTEAFFVPRHLVAINPLKLSAWAKRRLSIQQGELPIAVLLQEAHPMAAAKKVFNLSSHTRQRRLLQDGLQLRRIFALPHCDSVRILLPGNTNIIAMAKQTLVAMNIFRDRLTHMIAAPRGRIVGVRRRL